MKKEQQQTFENRHTELHYIAKSRPNRVGVAEVAKVINAPVRRTQRVLATLTEWGYLISDDCSPQGFKFNDDKAKELRFFK